MSEMHVVAFRLPLPKFHLMMMGYYLAMWDDRCSGIWGVRGLLYNASVMCVCGWPPLHVDILIGRSRGISKRCVYVEIRFVPPRASLGYQC